jgi:hypothetical protein
MPQSLATFFTWLGSSGVTAFIARTVITMGVSKMMAKSAMKKGARGVEMEPYRDPVAPRTFVYGQTRLSGPMLYYSTSGENNKFFHQIIGLAGHEITSIESHLIDGQVVTNGFGNLVANGDYSGLIRILFRLGKDDNAVMSELVSETNDGWANDDRLLGIAYAYVRMEFADVFNGGLPPYSAIIKGAKVYDPRLDSTEDGDGDHRKDDSSTWEWSDNPALCIAHYLTYPRVRGGYGRAWDKIDIAALAEAADDCDDEINGVTRYTLNGAFTTEEKPADILKSMLAAMAGDICWVNGRFVLRAGVYRAPVLELFEDDLINIDSVQVSTPLAESVNEVRGTWINPDTQYMTDDFAPVRADSYVTEDDGIEQYKDIDLTFTTDHTIARRLANIDLLKTRLGVRGQFTFHAQAIQLLPGDTVRLSLNRYGWFEDVDGSTGVITDVVDNIITSTAHGLENGDTVVIDGDIGTEIATYRYFIINKTTDTFQLSERRDGPAVVMPDDDSPAAVSWQQVVGKVFEVEGLTMSFNGTPPIPLISLSLREITSDVYDDPDAVAPPTPPSIQLPNPRDIETPTTLATVMEITPVFKDSAGVWLTSIRLTWDEATDPFVSTDGAVEVQYKPSADADWIGLGLLPGNATERLVENIKHGVDYDFQIRFHNGIGVRSDWELIEDVEVLGILPDPPTMFTGLAGKVWKRTVGGRDGNALLLATGFPIERSVDGQPVFVRSSGFMPTGLVTLERYFASFEAVDGPTYEQAVYFYADRALTTPVTLSSNGTGTIQIYSELARVTWTDRAIDQYLSRAQAEANPLLLGGYKYVTPFNPDNYFVDATARATFAVSGSDPANESVLVTIRLVNDFGAESTEVVTISTYD